jgi:hypothetical protein
MRQLEIHCFLEIAMHTPKALTRPQDIHLPYMEEAHKYNYIDIWLHQHEYNYTLRRNYSSFGHGLYVNFAVRHDYSSLAARALPQHCRAPRLLVTRPHRLYVNLAMRREYSSPGHSGSTSTTPYTAATSSSGRTTTSTTYLD